ncbi:hypothetical protein [Tabrizicola sp.]|uniref:hypothetical protein n=1 Tax=Tabrizicola sp. TaxID=2005166 RepID=UPI003F303B9A
MPLPIIAGIVIRAAVAFAAKQAAKYAGKKLAKRALRKLLERGRKQGDEILEREINRRKACKTCKKLDDLADPCQFLRSGTGSKYNGGSYAGTKKSGIESHHMPAESSYPAGSMSQGKMPAIAMDPADHKKTASHGSSDAARLYQKQQKAVLSGKGGLLGAFAMDVADVKLKFGDKYDQAIMEASAYVACISKYPDKYPVGQQTRRRKP